jgi:hypothetical protein
MQCVDFCMVWISHAHKFGPVHSVRWRWICRWPGGWGRLTTHHPHLPLSSSSSLSRLSSSASTSNTPLYSPILSFIFITHPLIRIVSHSQEYGASTGSQKSRPSSPPNDARRRDQIERAWTTPRPRPIPDTSSRTPFFDDHILCIPLLFILPVRPRPPRQLSARERSIFSPSRFPLSSLFFCLVSTHFHRVPLTSIQTTSCEL